MPFLGEYQHSLDAKGRVILPADFRTPLEGGAVIGKFPGECLAVYTDEEWGRVSEEIRLKSKEGGAAENAARAFFAGARSFTPDKQGRVAIPPNLREYAHLDREVVVIGVNSRLEIWDAERWRGRQSEGEAALAAGGLAGWGI